MPLSKPHLENEEVCAMDSMDSLDPEFRLNFEGPVLTVRGWPSSRGGGHYVLEMCDNAELEFLHLGGVECNILRSQDAQDEDAYCARMRMLGATFWKSDWAYYEHYGFQMRKNQRSLLFGWSAGGDSGVWVFKTDLWDPEGKLALAKIKMAANMEERCLLMEQSGDVFYSEPKSCPELELGS